MGVGDQYKNLGDQIFFPWYSYWTSQWITSDGHVWQHNSQMHKGHLQSREDGQTLWEAQILLTPDLQLAHSFHSCLQQ